MAPEEASIWIANHLFLDCARFLRQRIHKILLNSQVKALINLAAAAFWVFEIDSDEDSTVQGGRIPERHSDIVLYHVRTGNLLAREDILGFQGIGRDDLCVCLRGDAELLNVQTTLIRGNPDFPVTVSADFVGEGNFISFKDIMKVRGSSGEPGAGKVVLLRDLDRAKDAGSVPGRAGLIADRKTETAGLDRLWRQLKDTIDLTILAEELSQIRRKMEADNGHPEYRRLRHRISLIEIASRAGEGPKSLELMEGLENKDLQELPAGEAGLFQAILEEVAGRRKGP